MFVLVIAVPSAAQNRQLPVRVTLVNLRGFWLVLHPADSTQSGLVEIRQVDLVFLPHPRFKDERFNKGGNKHHETKTDI